MEKDVLYFESQRFNQWWLWLVLILINGLAVWAIIQQIVLGIQFGNNPMSNSGIIVFTILTLLFSIFCISLRLDTQIKKDGIYVKFYPVHKTYKFYPWSNIIKSYVREYRPIAEFGGWGFRGLGNNKALNVSGNKGLQLEMTNNKKLLIGTNNPIELSETLSSLGKLKP